MGIAGLERNISSRSNTEDFDVPLPDILKKEIPKSKWDHEDADNNNVKSSEQMEKKSQAIQVSKEDSLRHQMTNLTDLPYNMLFEIAKRLKKLEDFISFKCVSKYLHAAVKEEYFEGLWLRQKVPYLMLSVREDNDDIREFYSLVEGESIVASVKVSKFKSKKCLESLGWLLVSEEDGSMSLLDPFSGTEIPLPHQYTYPEYEDYALDALVFIHKMVLSSRPSENSDFILMVICGNNGHLAFWRPGDKAWNRIETRPRPGRYIDVVYNGGGQFYAVSCPGIIYAFNLSRNDHNDLNGRIIANCESIFHKINRLNRVFLCKTNDSFLLITRSARKLHKDGLSYITTKFQVNEFNTTTKTFKRIHCLGTMAVFLGHNSTFSVDVSESEQVIKANHIYFTDNNFDFYYFEGPKGGGMDMGVYNLETETIEPIYLGEPLMSKVSPSFWITPSF